MIKRKVPFPCHTTEMKCNKFLMLSAAHFHNCDANCVAVVIICLEFIRWIGQKKTQQQKTVHNDGGQLGFSIEIYDLKTAHTRRTHNRVMIRKMANWFQKQQQKNQEVWLYRIEAIHFEIIFSSFLKLTIKIYSNFS